MHTALQVLTRETRSYVSCPVCGTAPAGLNVYIACKYTFPIAARDVMFVIKKTKEITLYVYLYIYIQI